MNRRVRNQQTVARPAEVSGFGYWSGLDVTVEFRPAPPDSGLVFIRRDLASAPRIPVSIEHRLDVARRTTLGRGGHSVDMVEHVLAALRGLQIDNCEIWVDRAEMPGLDGSCRPIVQAIREAGIQAQAALRPVWVVDRTVRVGGEGSWIQIEPYREGLQIEYHLDYPDCPAIGRQTLQVDVTPVSFSRDLGEARTFVLRCEAEWLREQGFGHRVQYHDLLVFDERGPIGNTLRWPDECVRHKTLDVIGDLALAPFELFGRVVAWRSGHQLNAELVRRLLPLAASAPRIKSA